MSKGLEGVGRDLDSKSSVLSLGEAEEAFQPCRSFDQTRQNREML